VEISPARDDLHGLAETGLFEAICAFTPDLWREISTRHATRNEALRAYVTGGTKNVLRPTAADIGRWAAMSREAGLLICRAAGHRWSCESSADDILLALPHIEPGPTEIEGVDSLLHRFLDAVQAADSAGDELLLGVLCEYGRRYELIVETEVPIMEPFTLKVSEDRPLDLSARWTRQSFAINEARSAHLEARFRDPNVTFSQFEVLDANGVPFGIGRLESARRTIETLSLYTSDPDRPLYAEVRLKLRLARHLYATGGFFMHVEPRGGGDRSRPERRRSVAGSTGDSLGPDDDRCGVRAHARADGAGFTADEVAENRTAGHHSPALVDRADQNLGVPSHRRSGVALPFAAMSCRALN
jgi:hypothetical protein